MRPYRSPLTRRDFLQFTGSALGTIALSQLDGFTQAANLLAQPSHRKYALLIGIDNYDISPLSGCNTDVDLQRELLIHRYGFNPQDILELRDREATYDNIIAKFRSHLIKQAQPGDLVVFHFSGHGSRVRDRSGISDFQRKGISLNGTIVPIDWQTENPNQVRQIMGKTLFLLSSQLKTNNVVMILDSCHSEGGLRGNSRVRSIDSRMNSGDGYPNVVDAEGKLQSELQRSIGWSDAELKQRRKKGAAKGVAMGAARFDQLANTIDLEALELYQNGFVAGTFTYLLTRYLWQSSGNRSLDSAFTQLIISSAFSSNSPGQHPVYQVEPNSGNGQKPIFFTASPLPAADGVIHKMPKGNQVEFWLGGASPDSLKAYQTAVFNVIDRNGKIIGQVQQTSRADLTGYGTITLDAGIQPQVGMLLREKIREIPDTLTLKIGLDASLGNDLPTIKQGLSEMPQIKIVPIAEKQEVDYIVGQSRELRLFTHQREPLSATFGEKNDTIETRLDHLRRHLKTLQAKQLLKTMMGDAATMKISVDLIPVEITDPEKKTTRPIGEPQTVMSQGAISANSSTAIVSPKFPPNSAVQLQLRNQESVPLYMAVMVIARDGSLAVAYPYAIDAPIDEALVAPTSEKLLQYAFGLKSTTSTFELLVISSRRPLNKLLVAVKNIADDRDARQRGTLMSLEDDQSIEFATDMLTEIDEISQRAGARPAFPGRKTVDMNQLAVLSTIVRVTE